MPTEKTKKQKILLTSVKLIKQAEINLDDKGEPKKLKHPVKEEKIEVEQVPEDKSFENEREKLNLKKKENKDELKEYSDGVQKRIAKLNS